MKKTPADKVSVASKKTADVRKPVAPQQKNDTKKVVEPIKQTAVGHQCLSPAELQSFGERLRIVRARLRGDVITMTDAALNKNRMEGDVDHTAMPIHMADIGSDNFEQEQTLSFMQSEHGLLEMVDEALARLKEGTYGICEGCECRIPRGRLDAIPYAIKCVQCAASDEQD